LHESGESTIVKDLSQKDVVYICYQTAREIKRRYKSKWSDCIDAYLMYYHGMNFDEDGDE